MEDRYYLLIVEDAPIFIGYFSYKLAIKSHLFFSNFKKMVECQFDMKIKQVQTNSSVEFKPLPKILADNGIVYRLTCPLTWSQTCMVKSRDRCVADAGLDLFFKSNVPISYWPYTFRSMVNTLNWVPSKVHHFQSPYAKLYGVSCDYNVFASFWLLEFSLSWSFQ